jgi:cell division protein ZapA
MKDALNQQLHQLRNRIKDPFTINLHILGQTMNLTIEREEEILYRQAERLINLRYNMYASLYADVRDRNRFSAMTMLDLALMAQRSDQSKQITVSKLNDITHKIANQLLDDSQDGE